MNILCLNPELIHSGIDKRFLIVQVGGCMESSGVWSNIYACVIGEPGLIVKNL